jgi:hypothetical protein
MRRSKTEVGNRKLYRNKLKAFYKKKRSEDAIVGRQVNRLMQILHQQDKLPEEKQNEGLIKSTVEQINTLRQEDRFRLEFPTFASFKNFVKTYGITLEELREL